jgi:hypothetical protein
MWASIATFVHFAIALAGDSSERGRESLPAS